MERNPQNYSVKIIMLCFHWLIPNELTWLINYNLLRLTRNWFLLIGHWHNGNDFKQSVINCQNIINYSVNWMIWQSLNIARLHSPEVHICLSKRNHESRSLSYGVQYKCPEKHEELIFPRVTDIRQYAVNFVRYSVVIHSDCLFVYRGLWKECSNYFHGSIRWHMVYLCEESW